MQWRFRSTPQPHTSDSTALSIISSQIYCWDLTAAEDQSLRYVVCFRISENMCVLYVSVHGDGGSLWKLGILFRITREDFVTFAVRENSRFYMMGDCRNVDTYIESFLLCGLRIWIPVKHLKGQQRADHGGKTLVICYQEYSFISWNSGEHFSSEPTYLQSWAPLEEPPVLFWNTELNQVCMTSVSTWVIHGQIWITCNSSL
jgi:hypothetical protein